MKKLFCLGTAIIAALATPAISQIKTPNWGTLQVTVVDEEGNYVSEAPVYVYRDRKDRITAAKEADKIVRFELPAGTYKLYAAKARPVRDGVARYTSYEATVHVPVGENASVLLKLRPQADETSFEISDAVRSKIGLDPQLAKYLD